MESDKDKNLEKKSTPQTGVNNPELGNQVNLSNGDRNFRPRVRLSGAGRKRLKWFLARGVPLEVARKLAQETILFRNASIKRQRTDEATPEVHSCNKIKKQEEQTETEKPTCSQKDDLSTLILAVIPVGFPKVFLSEAEQVAVINKLTEFILVEPKETVKPKFFGCVHKPGYLVIDCEDPATVNWTKDKVNKIPFWEGPPVKAIGEDELPKSVTTIGYFPRGKEHSIPKLLSFLEKQNEGLNTSHWEVLSRTENKLTSVVNFSIDYVSADMLRKKTELSCMLGRAKFELKG